MSQVELAAFVQTQLAKNGIDAILSGGAAVSYYVGDKYVSKDIDLVLEWIVSRVNLNKVMKEIGFAQKAKYYQHPASDHIVEIIGDLPSAGNEAVTNPIDKVLPTGTLRILSPTDCVKDRLAAFYHWGDTEVLEQALLVAKTQEVDLNEIERWSKAEGKESEYAIFLGRLDSE